MTATETKDLLSSGWDTHTSQGRDEPEPELAIAEPLLSQELGDQQSRRSDTAVPVHCDPVVRKANGTKIPIK